MEPNYFFFLILPLGVLVFFLTAVIVYNSRKEVDEYEKEVKKLRQLLFSGKLDRNTFLNMRNRLKHEKAFLTESKKLFTLLSDEKIDEDTYIRLRHVLEKSFKERLDKLDVVTTELNVKEPFDASKF
jgi:hypothetical protein